MKSVKCKSVQFVVCVAVRSAVESTLTNMQRGDSLKENHKAVGVEGHTQVQMLPHSCTAGYSEAATSVA